MQKWIKTFAALTIGAMVLAGCGTTETDGGQAGGNAAPNESTKPKPESSPEKEQPKQGENNNGEKNQQTEKIRLMEQKIDYSINGQQKSETAFLKESGNQNYSMYVLPDYELTAEEPKKDVLYLKEQDEIFMRIELLPSDTALESAAADAQEQLKAVNNNVQKNDALKKDDWLQKAEVYSAENDTDKVTAVLVPQEQGILKLSIFTKKDGSQLEPFLKMAQTIEKK